MEKTFDHLLGLSARSALSLLKGYGITDVKVTLTGAPPMAAHRAPACVPKGGGRVSALESISRQFSAGDDEADDDAGFDPLLDASLDEGMLVESRVVAVRDDGRLLVVARFHVGEPKPCVVKETGKQP
jgi:hypothetical protein